MKNHASDPLRSDEVPGTLNAAIVGGGKGCESILKMVQGDSLRRLRMRILGVADTDPNAQGTGYAREIGIPLVVTDYKQLYEIAGLHLIIELTGKDEVRDEIEHTRPRHIRLIDHFGAQMFWDLHQAEEAVIRQRTEMREKVEVERQRIAQILDSVPDEIVVVDTEMMIQDANSTFLRNNNLDINEVKGRHCYDVDQTIRGDCQVAVGNCPFLATIREGKTTSLVRKHFGPEGKVMYASIVGAPLMNNNGEMAGMIEMTRDITERISLEEDLKATEIRLQQFMDFAPLATYVKNRSGQYIDVNPATCAMFGKNKGDILGKTDFEIFPREAAEVIRSGDKQAWKERNAVSLNMEVQLGERRVFLSTVKFPILDLHGSPTALCGLSTDITAQKDAEIKLNETWEYLQQILDNSSVIIITTNLEGIIVSFSHGAEISLGYAPDEIIGKPATILYQDPSKRKEFLDKIWAGIPVQDYSYELMCKDGTMLPVSITLSPLKDAAGNVIGTVGISKDISHRKVLMTQVLQSERMAAVGRLASGVAHEINNPLAVIGEISGFLYDLVKPGQKIDLDELLKEAQEGIPKIVRQIERGKKITHRLLSFARKSEARIAVVDVNPSLDEILPFLEKEASLAQAVIHRDYQPDLPKVAVEEMQLQEVFINLITNAIHALANQEGGNIWLSTCYKDGKVVVQVKDDGPGIEESVRYRLFEPFVSSKPTGQGTGLGLSICYGIVKRYDGEIRVISEPGQGTTFRVIFPAIMPQQ